MDSVLQSLNLPSAAAPDDSATGGAGESTPMASSWDNGDIIEPESVYRKPMLFSPSSEYTETSSSDGETPFAAD